MLLQVQQIIIKFNILHWDESNDYAENSIQCASNSPEASSAFITVFSSPLFRISRFKINIASVLCKLFEDISIPKHNYTAYYIRGEFCWLLCDIAYMVRNDAE